MKKSNVIVLGLIGIFALIVFGFYISGLATSSSDVTRMAPQRLITKAKMCADDSLCLPGEKLCKLKEDGTYYSQTCVLDNSTGCYGWSTPVDCQYGCWKDQCLPYSCSDSDGGVNYNQQGSVFEGTVLTGQQLIDGCFDSSTVTEHSCKAAAAGNWDENYGWLKKENYNCPGGCLNGACRSYYRVFVTRNSYQGNLGGVGGADEKCQNEAVEANLGGNWKAWISNSNQNFILVDPNHTFYHSDIPYRRLDGVIIANDWQDLTDRTLDAPINVASNGETINSFVWTATYPEGVGSGSLYSCLAWTSNSGGATSFGSGGNSSSITNTWSVYRGDKCNLLNRLYCFEQP